MIAAGRPLRVLLIEDVAEDAELVLMTLRRSGFAPDFVRVQAARELREALAAGPWDVVLSDYSLPGFGAAAAMAIVRETDPDTPFIVVSGTIGEALAVEIMLSGANDYVLKPFDRKAIASSLSKFRTLQTAFQGTFQRDAPATALPNLNKSLRQLVAQLRPGRRSSFLVNYKGKYYPVPVSEIAFFYTENEIVWLHKLSGERYALDHKLDELETLLDPAHFYRANRQFIIRFEAIREFESYFNRKLAVRLQPAPPEPVIISKAKAGDFMHWLEQR